MSFERLDFEWVHVGAIPPDELLPARTALHNAAQYVAAAGKSLLPERADDSHTSMVWSERDQALIGERVGNPEGHDAFRVGLRLQDVTLLVLASGDFTAELSLEGRTLADGLDWLQSQVERFNGGPKKISLPTHYEILSPMNKRETFVIESREPYGELARYFANADRVFRSVREELPEVGPIRCWPHHFDTGGLLLLEPSKPAEEAKTIGFGLSPGDDNCGEPYFYINPYSQPDAAADRLPPLRGAGQWHTEGWVGALLPASQFTTLENPLEQKALVVSYFRTAWPAVSEILPAD